MILSLEEVKELQRFLFSVGYISYEHFESIHLISKRIDNYLKEQLITKENENENHS